ncbi:hypothetical protein [Caenimonas aquaedulcis]|uniref:Uncharacterized protein n=1 Tax=Caenimonas aquaedulcis TaxID=2793270 RepID=A0A931H683_9BURK|nr:hypothetical protein [Caenimonas aquaedulcis]MBG9389410.1 hypothetical protein [Caenimonas aquaedulcis]
MYTLSMHRIAFSALFFAALAALVTGVVAAWGMQLSPVLGLASLVVSGLLFWGVAALHNAVREARWDAGQRLR